MLKDEKLVSVLALLWCIAAYNMYAAMSKCFFFLYLPSAARCADRRVRSIPLTSLPSRFDPPFTRVALILPNPLPREPIWTLEFSMGLADASTPHNYDLTAGHVT